MAAAQQDADGYERVWAGENPIGSLAVKLGILTVAGVGGYLIYKAMQPAAAASTASLSTPPVTPASAPSPSSSIEPGPGTLTGVGRIPWAYLTN